MRLDDLLISKWLNVGADFSLQSLKGKVVAVHAFQMLCPGCVSHGIPQAQKMHDLFDEEHLAVVGVHTVFEHHEAMREVSLQAFLYEFRVGFPVGIDTADSTSPIPKTMRAFSLRGTPTWLIFNGEGHLELNLFGRVEDMAIGAEIGVLIRKDQAKSGSLYRQRS